MDDANLGKRRSAPAHSQPSLASLLADPAVSRALKTVLRRWATRDAIDAAEDATLLAHVFGRLADERCGLNAATLNPPDLPSSPEVEPHDPRG